MTSASSGTASLVVEEAVGQGDTDRPVGVAAADALAAGDDSEVAVEAGEQVVELDERRHHRQPAAGLGTDRVAGEVPRRVLAEVAHRRVFRAEVLDEVDGVGRHHVDDVAERRRRWGRAAGEDGEEVAEQPRSAEAAAADDDTVAAGRPHHRQGVGRRPRCRRCRAPGSS